CRAGHGFPLHALRLLERRRDLDPGWSDQDRVRAQREAAGHRHLHPWRAVRRHHASARLLLRELARQHGQVQEPGPGPDAAHWWRAEMSLIDEQVAFMRDVRKLLDFADSQQFAITGGELERTLETQASLMRAGRESSMDNPHLRRCAITLNFFHPRDNRFELE